MTEQDTRETLSLHALTIEGALKKAIDAGESRG